MSGGARRALVASLLVAALLVVGLPAAADAPQARGIARVCPAPNATSGTDAPRFTDLDGHGPSIECAASYGIVSGFVDGTFRPTRPVTRGQMAAFVAAWVRTATGIALPAAEEQVFSDVEGTTHAAAIGALAAAGIVGGRTDGSFGPGDTLTRGQFTRAVTNAISYADVFEVGGPLPPDDVAVQFTDVAGTTFEREILALAGAGIALGTADGGFRPRASVTRGQMATFSMRSADYLDRHQRWLPTARTAVLVADLEAVGSSPGTAAFRGEVTLIVNAFNGTLVYVLDLSQVSRAQAPTGATLHLGDPSGGGAVVLTLADAEALDAATGGVVSDVVLEADSRVRFAELLVAPGDAYVQVATEAAPEGAGRGVLRLLEP